MGFPIIFFGISWTHSPPNTIKTKTLNVIVEQPVPFPIWALAHTQNENLFNFLDKTMLYSLTH